MGFEVEALKKRSEVGGRRARLSEGINTRFASGSSLIRRDKSGFENYAGTSKGTKVTKGLLLVEPYGSERGDFREGFGTQKERKTDASRRLRAGTGPDAI